jgi:hypothetical protein
MFIHDPPNHAAKTDCSRLAEVHIAGGRRISLKVFADGFEDIARGMIRDRFLMGVFEAGDHDQIMERAILIPTNRIDCVVDLDE